MCIHDPGMHVKNDWKGGKRLTISKKFHKYIWATWERHQNPLFDDTRKYSSETPRRSVGWPQTRTRLINHKLKLDKSKACLCSKFVSALYVMRRRLRKLQGVQVEWCSRSKWYRTLSWSCLHLFNSSVEQWGKMIRELTASQTVYARTGQATCHMLTGLLANPAVDGDN